jgi:hypothetical protein
MQEIPHKQGDTFRLSVTFRDPVTKEPVDMTGKEVRVSTRMRNGMPLRGISIDTLSAAGGVYEINCSAVSTKAWPVGLTEADITVIEGGEVSSTKSFGIFVEREV